MTLSLLYFETVNTFSSPWRQYKNPDFALSPCLRGGTFLCVFFCNCSGQNRLSAGRSGNKNCSVGVYPQRKRFKRPQ